MTAVVEPDAVPLIVYVDTSSAVKLLRLERESAAMAAFLDRADVIPVSSDLLETELRRSAWRHGVPQSYAQAALSGIHLTPIDRALFRGAGLLAHPALRSLDALHLTAALEVEAQAILTYDERMAEAAIELGLAVVRPEDEPEE